MIKKAFHQKELRKKIILTIIVLIIVTALSGIPTPGVNKEYFKKILESNSSLSMLNILSGNGFGNASITMLSITPYITASIILQLLTIVIPDLEEMQKDGKTGMDKFKKLTAVLGIVLAFVQALGYAVGFGRQGLLISYKWYWVLCVTVIWTAMAGFLILAGEFIDKKGFGNGISLILLFNILSSYPSDTLIVYNRFIRGQKIGSIVIHAALIIAFVTLLFAFVILVQGTEKRIIVRYSAKMRGSISAGKSVFPIKLCPGSVVPVIFASSIMSVPSLIAQMMGRSFWIADMLNSSNWFKGDKPLYSLGVVIYIVLIFGFSFFYNDIILNPLEIANNFKQSGGCIPGIRPGAPTVEYIKEKIRNTTLLGAAALSLVALVPCVLSGLYGLSRLSFAGTSIIITAGVILETYDRLDSDTQIQKMRLF